MGVREIKDYKLSEGTDFFVYIDKDKKGPSHARNEVLKHFSDYDIVFLWDDDTYPTMTGWEEYFISQASLNNVDYMCLPEPFSADIYLTDNEMLLWNSALGCFSFQTKRALEIIGGYNTEYDRYGYEDAARSVRARRAGLTGHSDLFSFPVKGLCYVYSEDVYHKNPTANISKEDKEAYIAKNHSIYAKEITSDILYYPYKEE